VIAGIFVCSAAVSATLSAAIPTTPIFFASSSALCFASSPSQLTQLPQ
jgi:hypothetical protein